MTRRFQNGDNGDSFMKLFGESIGGKEEEENFCMVKDKN